MEENPQPSRISKISPENQETFEKTKNLDRQTKNLRENQKSRFTNQNPLRKPIIWTDKPKTFEKTKKSKKNNKAYFSGNPQKTQKPKNLRENQKKQKNKKQ